MNEAGTIAALLQNQRLMEARIAALESLLLRAGEHAAWMAEAIQRAVAQT